MTVRLSGHCCCCLSVHGDTAYRRWWLMVSMIFVHAHITAAHAPVCTLHMFFRNYEPICSSC